MERRKKFYTIVLGELSFRLYEGVPPDSSFLIRELCVFMVMKGQNTLAHLVARTVVNFVQMR